MVAKYGKDLIYLDLQGSKRAEELLQDYYFYTKAAEQLKEMKPETKRAGFYVGDTGLGLAGLEGLLKNLKLKTNFSENLFKNRFDWSSKVGSEGLLQK